MQEMQPAVSVVKVFSDTSETTLGAHYILLCSLHVTLANVAEE